MNSHHTNGSDAGFWPENVGIVAIEVYFPSQYVDQAELEQFDGVAAGKYTIGLGQSKMGFCSDREDIHSICLTVVQRLVEKNNIAYSSIGRLEVGTETIVDKSKSVKSVLMSLFEKSGNTDIEGADSTNACYGGTAALFNSISWIESSAYDGRYALAVAGDIAVYATGAARPTGGAGAIAILLGANAPIVFDRGLRASHMNHAYDFYKPNLSSEYPVVDGKLSVVCYLSALDKCYQRYCAKADERNKGKPTSLSSFDAILFHCPYCKLVQKSTARLALNDFVSGRKDMKKGDAESTVQKYKDIRLEDTYEDRDVEKAFIDYSKDDFSAKVKPALLLSNQVGNMYTPSLYSGLVSWLINTPPSVLPGQRIALFSYGSGLCSSMFSVEIVKSKHNNSELQKLLDGLSDVKERLEKRTKVSPEEFSKIMKLREDTHHQAPYEPVGSVKVLFPGTFYLSNIDDKHRRKYERKSVN